MRLNEPNMVSVKHSRDSAFQSYSESLKENMEYNMKNLYEAALILRKGILKCDEILTLLHGFSMVVEYNRLLRVESDIEKSVLA